MSIIMTMKVILLETYARCLPAFQLQVLRSQRLYEELVLRKESRLYVEHMNDKALKRVLDCLAETEEEGWELVAKKDKGEVVVYRKCMPGLDGKPSKFHCVKVGRMTMGCLRG